MAHRNRILGRLVVCAIGLGVAVAGARAGLEAYQRGALPQIPDLMAATTKAIVESLPGTPDAAAAPQPGQTLSGPAVPDSAPSLLAPSDSAALAASGPIALTVAAHGDSVALQPAPPVTAPAASVPAPTPTPPAPAPAASSLAPVVPQGRTELAAGMFAVRVGDTVTVYFDTPEARTRRPEKFEQIVRATLPRIHGGAAAALLETIAPGMLIGAVDLVNELPVRGLHLRGSDGRTLSLWPETRPGRDGPLVVAYRATPTR